MSQLFRLEDKRNRFIYRIGIKSNEIISILSNDGIDHFVSPVTKKGKKLYLLGKNGIIHYVGVTKQSITIRLRYGVKPNHKTGYHGYKWLKENGDHCIVIWTFDNDINIEAIEAEIVYFFRKQYDHWPKYQTEIHFHPTSNNERSLAKKILVESQSIVRNFV